MGNVKIGVVGKSTLNRLKQYKINADFCPNKFLVEELIKESLNHTNENDNILIITSNLSNVETDDISSKYKRNFTKLELYNTIKIKYEEKIMIDNINMVNYITFFSPSAVEAFFESIINNVSIIADKKIVSIGPVTSKKLRSYNINVHLEAKEFCLEGVIDTLLGDK